MKTKNTIEHLRLLPFLILLLLIVSCASKKDLVYFQDEVYVPENVIENYPVLTYKPGDMLTIDVSASEPEAAKPFNLPAVSYNNNVISANGSLKMQTYLIDNEGNINFPVVGTIKLSGLNRAEATDLLHEKIKPYLKDPIINIRISNFTVTVLGEVKNPGTYVIQDERVSLTQALGLAGDLTVYGERNNVLLIREIDGKKYFDKFDLTSVNVLNSQNYYLAQNDVIYITPNKARARSSQYTQNNSVLISAIATLATIAAILIK